jgi:hypothetical protein
MATDRTYKTIKVDRGWYFVEYYPATNLSQCAILNLVITIEDADKISIIEAMEKELREWLLRYPVLLLVSAWDNAERLYKFEELNKTSHLTGFIDEAGKVFSSWSPDKNKIAPVASLSQEYLDNLYSNIEYTTDAEYDADRKKRRQQIKLGYILIVVLPFIWGFVYESFFYFSGLLALLAFIYFIIKTSMEAFRLLGVLPKSKKEKEKEEQNILKNYYYYYCKMNPQGFEKLKLEALEKMAKDEIAKQAAELKAKAY